VLDEVVDLVADDPDFGVEGLPASFEIMEGELDARDHETVWGGDELE
jgi:hypothetical protein